ncbi:unnamed protein product [Hymenolepis diminuta]|uniref:Uncharacterized protein n=1 Tax=Hymenolepis diminuta TaxID=6216 RepID=A0A564XZC7_HYMDI|nr:unnamed protein product [Hymenolepis diminuta]
MHEKERVENLSVAPPPPTLDLSRGKMKDIETIIKVLKWGRRELGDISGQDHFRYAVSGKCLAEAVDDDANCGGFERTNDLPKANRAFLEPDDRVCTGQLEMDTGRKEGVGGGIGGGGKEEVPVLKEDAPSCE